MTHYPKVDELQQDLYSGFEMLGAIHEGANWHRRADERYSKPTPVEEFYILNQRTIEETLRTRKPNKHSEAM